MPDANLTAEKKDDVVNNPDDDPLLRLQQAGSSPHYGITHRGVIEASTPVVSDLRELSPLNLGMGFTEFRDLQTRVSITLLPSLPTRLIGSDSTPPIQTDTSTRLSAPAMRTTVHIGQPRNLPSQKELLLKPPPQ